ncbi:hypothetical protein RFI_23257, partial [Reticulomyxa filosa]
MAEEKVSSEKNTKKTEKTVSKDLDYIKSKITKHENFPKEGVLFYDIFPALRDSKCLDMIITRLLSHIYDEFGNKVDVICGLDSRGFLFGTVLSLRMGIAFVPIRKKGTLPGKCVSLKSTKEYGSDVLEIQSDAILPGQSVILVDDLLATGGTLNSSVQLIQFLNATVLECIVVIELLQLKGRDKVPSS